MNEAGCFSIDYLLENDGSSNAFSASMVGSACFSVIFCVTQHCQHGYDAITYTIQHNIFSTTESTATHAVWLVSKSGVSCVNLLC